ncbi:MAG: GFA family protein [Pseudomonadota bacterium]
MNQLATGRCLCGGIHYEFPRAAVLAAGHCHCTDCQKATGSGKATIVFVEAAALNIDGELRSFTVTGSEGTQVTRSFCPTCGSPLISSVAEQPGLVFIKAGSLDTSDWVNPSASYWTCSATRWDPVQPATQQHPRNPAP